MSEHTPTTEQLRKGLLTGYVSDSEFDRCLEFFGKAEQLKERERILKLIEKINNHGMTHSEACLRWHLFAERLTQALNEEASNLQKVHIASKGEEQ